ncbi:MAG: restriction endonuclease [Candidatus Hodarchaeota archaeon]
MQYWVVRAGEGGKYIDEFLKYNFIAIGWADIKNAANIKSRAETEKLIKRTYSKDSKQAIIVNTTQFWSFLGNMQKGDVVLTPNSLTRTINIGVVKSDYQYGTKKLGDMPYKHRRKISWQKEVSRDVFSANMKNSIGSTLTIFNISKYSKEIDAALYGTTTGMPLRGGIKFPIKPKEELVIGEPLDFEGLTNAPMEENGVIFLFGKLHERMGIRIKAIRKGFPDATGEVWIKNRLYPRTFEFEFRSSDFKRHGHDPENCDIIVCWEHDWTECPKNLFVIELKSELEKYIK